MTRKEIIKLMRDVAPLHTTHWARDMSGVGHWFTSKPHAGDIAWLTRGELYRAPAWRNDIRGSWNQTRIALWGEEEEIPEAPEAQAAPICALPSTFYCSVAASGSPAGLLLPGQTCAGGSSVESAERPVPGLSRAPNKTHRTHNSILFMSKEFSPDLTPAAVFAAQIRVNFDESVYRAIGRDTAARALQEIVSSVPKHQGETLMVWLDREEDKKIAGLTFYWF